MITIGLVVLFIPQLRARKIARNGEIQNSIYVISQWIFCGAQPVLSKRTPKYSQIAPIAAKIKDVLNHLISLLLRIVFLPTSIASINILRIQMITVTV